MDLPRHPRDCPPARPGHVQSGRLPGPAPDPAKSDARPQQLGPQRLQRALGQRQNGVDVATLARGRGPDDADGAAARRSWSRAACPTAPCARPDASCSWPRAATGPSSSPTAPPRNTPGAASRTISPASTTCSTTSTPNRSTTASWKRWSTWTPCSRSWITGCSRRHKFGNCHVIAISRYGPLHRGLRPLGGFSYHANRRDRAGPAAVLPERYVIRAGKRSYVVLAPEHLMVPDIAVLPPRSRGRRKKQTAGTAVAEPAPKAHDRCGHWLKQSSARRFSKSGS